MLTISNVVSPETWEAIVVVLTAVVAIAWWILRDGGHG